MRSVSVVVPTRDRPAALARCLAALSLQETSGSFEVIVVDDADEPQAETVELLEADPRARLLRTRGRGAAAARNAGVRAAKGSIVAFADDDCVPSPAWLDALAGAIEAGADVAGGRTDNGVAGDPFVAASEAIRRHLEEWARARPAVPFVASNNLACRRALALEVPFDESYAGAGGEDRDWCARAALHGARFQHVEDAVLAHVPDMALAGFWRQHVRYGRGAFRFARSPASGRRWQPLGFYAGLVRRGFADGTAVGLLVLLAQLATGWGYLREAARAAAAPSPPARSPRRHRPKV